MVLWSSVEEETESWKHKSSVIAPFHAISCTSMPFHAVSCDLSSIYKDVQLRKLKHLDQVMTTNHPEKLDPALIRPGRINKRFHLGFVDAETLLKMLVGQVRIDERIFMDILDGWHGLGVNSLCRLLLNPTWFLVCRVKVVSCYIPMFWFFGSPSVAGFHQVGISSVASSGDWRSQHGVVVLPAVTRSFVPRPMVDFFSSQIVVRWWVNCPFLWLVL